MASHEIYVVCSAATYQRLLEGLAAALGTTQAEAEPHLEETMARAIEGLSRSPELLGPLLARAAPPSRYPPTPEREPKGGASR